MWGIAELSEWYKMNNPGADVAKSAPPAASGPVVLPHGTTQLDVNKIAGLLKENAAKHRGLADSESLIAERMKQWKAESRNGKHD